MRKTYIIATIQLEEAFPKDKIKLLKDIPEFVYSITQGVPVFLKRIGTEKGDLLKLYGEYDFNWGPYDLAKTATLTHGIVLGYLNKEGIITQQSLKL